MLSKRVKDNNIDDLKSKCSLNLAGFSDKACKSNTNSSPERAFVLTSLNK